MDLSLLVSSPVCIKVGEREYKLAPLTLGQLGELEAWARRQIYAELPGKLKALEKAKLDAAELRRLRDAVLAETDRASRDPLEQVRMMDSMAGTRQAFALALRACQPVDDKELEAICSVSGLMQIKQWVEQAYTGKQTPELAKPADPPTAQEQKSPSA